MLKLEQIPDEVAWKLHNKLWGSTQFSVEEGRAAIAAAINAWPGMKTKLANSINVEPREQHLILPLTEPRDDAV